MRIQNDTNPLPRVERPHSQPATEVAAALQAPLHGLSLAAVEERLALFGRNTLPRPKPLSALQVLLRQFLSPLIYILLIAAIISLALQEWSDAIFIFAVLVLNAVIGALQEYSAQQSALALQQLVSTRARVQRQGDAYEISAEELVPGDIVLLESGSKVPADLRLLDSHDLEIDESLLTGESLPVGKQAQQLLPAQTGLGDRLNMAFAGTMVNRGRGRGIVVGTALNTEIGRLASEVLNRPATKPPLLLRMERFTTKVAIFVGGAALLMAAISLSRGTPLAEVFLLTVALAVSAIPEGLPVALTVALAIGMRRMAKRNVIVRRLVAVEALGSCTFIASDKTGTLTINELTARRIVIPGHSPWEITGEGTVPEGLILRTSGAVAAPESELISRLALAATLANEGFLAHRDGTWSHNGDAVDIALLVMAHKAGITQTECRSTYPELASIPFESENLFAASLNRIDGQSVAFVKGALERLLPMCTTLADDSADKPLDPLLVEAAAQTLAQHGYRVLALASGIVHIAAGEDFNREHLHGLTLLGLVGMIDPLRPETRGAVAACRQAGIEVCMVTGDHPITALSIARELDMASEPEQVVTGPQLQEAQKQGEAAVDALTRRGRVFARIEPRQKLDIVKSLARSGHFVAVTGDGANDAPALRAAHVGVAMGRSGTDVARETAELILADDNFASIINGVEEGRVAYANVRKVIFLLISTGAAELVMFTLALLTGLPPPLLAVQLLWLNLVTNGIQDVALAFEPAEGDELRKRPRPPREAIFNRLMIERVVITAVTMGGVAYAIFQWLLNSGYSIEEARNGTLLLMVLFENVHVFNSRSETLSTFRHNLLGNPLLLFGTLTAQLIHIAAMYTPWLNDVLGIQPVSFTHWLQLLGLALSILLVMEAHKALRAGWRRH